MRNSAPALRRFNRDLLRSQADEVSLSEVEDLFASLQEVAIPRDALLQDRFVETNDDADVQEGVVAAALEAYMAPGLAVDRAAGYEPTSGGLTYEQRQLLGVPTHAPQPQGQRKREPIIIRRRAGRRMTLWDKYHP